MFMDASGGHVKMILLTSMVCVVLCQAGTLSIGDAVNLAVLEEMIRDPTTTIHAEDLQAGYA
jgi:hypothetical protein